MATTELETDTATSEPGTQPDVGLAQIIHSLLRLVLAIRYRRNLVIAVMAASAVAGFLYYATATRKYAAKAGVLVSQTGRDNLDTSITNQDSQRQQSMLTFESMIQSVNVLKGAFQYLAPEDRIDIAGAPEEKWPAALRGGLKVSTIRSTNILEVSYRSKDPGAAANVVRAVVQSYLDFMDRVHRGTTGDLSLVLTQERDRLSEQLTCKQRDLLQARHCFADMGFRSGSQTLHPTVQRAVCFNDALIAAQKQRVEQEASLAAIHVALRNGEDLGQYILTLVEVVGGEVLLNSLGFGPDEAAMHAEMEQARLTAEAEFQSKQVNLGPLHPEVVALAETLRTTGEYFEAFQRRLDDRVAGLQRNELGPWLVQIVQQRLNESKNKEQILQDRFEEARTEAINVSGQLAQIELLDRDVKRLSSIHDVLLNQIASIDLRQNRRAVRVAVIEEPVVANSPVSPRLGYVVFLTFVGGFGVALGMVTLLDGLDDRFRSIDEMQARLGVPALGVIPRLAMAEGGGVESLPLQHTPRAVESECFRTLRTALTLTQADARQIVITSAEPGDGKSTVLANLGVCYAQADKRTLLIDGDMRRPGLTTLMRLRGLRGLSDVLQGKDDIEAMAASHIRTTSVRQLDILSAGPRPMDPSELLNGLRFSQLLAWAGNAYDLVLVDSPPLLAASDTAIIGRLVDGAMIVVQPAKNRRRLVTRVVERLGYLEIPVFGVIANRIEPKENQGYYGYGYGYDYKYYGADESSSGKSPTSSRGRESVQRVPDPDSRHDDDREGEESVQRLIPRRAA